ncbi:hypothetical protein GCM10025869_27660 [Homoserinibacter gongjuensis]|uniref:HhH-GPD domain-containing protein n=1 Tax=Homoserinibacter gongjuensis TaxID=1162968 RepID=A0ABQ6JZY4_9MICO|nr:hypothetical protein GCM10025869_27660 [Homoserinibacter gongjuensis]
MGGEGVGERVASWFAAGHRPLPWRAADFPAWGVLVSEFMLQQTPVARVIPRLEEWLARWPTPALLASEPPGEAVRAWDRLGYPRRALNLHAASVAITERHGGVVPADVDELLALPGSARTPHVPSRPSPTEYECPSSTSTCGACSRGPFAAWVSPAPHARARSTRSWSRCYPPTLRPRASPTPG